MTTKVTFDFETRSHVPLAGPLSVGSYLYSKHPTTEVMCASWRIDWPNGAVTKARWHPAYEEIGIQEEGFEDLAELLEVIEKRDWITGHDDVVIEAHNASFERNIWMNVCVPKLGWPAVDDRMWRCSAAKASAHALPRKLEDGCKALRLDVQKDMAGHRVMTKLCRPKKDGAWPGTAEEFQKLFDYCDRDVEAEHGLSSQLVDLTPLEQEIWFMDQTINARGVMVDVRLATKAVSLVDEIKTRNNRKFAELTGLKTVSQRDAFKAWMDTFADRPLADTQGTTLVSELARGYSDPDVQAAVELVYRTNRSSTKKFETMLRLSDPDDSRVRGTLVYCGAERTGRFAGRGIQPHNYPKGKVKDMDAACDEVLDNDLAELEAAHPDVMERLSHIARGAIVAPPGRDLMVSDFAAIEARVILWYAGEEEMLELIRSGQCIYCDMASDIYGRPIARRKGELEPERNLGKQAVLGLGFGMGWPKFVATCERFGIVIDEKLAAHAVKVYRNKCKKVVGWWTLQEDTAVHAMKNPGEWHQAGRVSWALSEDRRFLRCRLPSGRDIVYPWPQLVHSMSYYFRAKKGADGELQWFTLTNNSGNPAPWTHEQVMYEARRKARKAGVVLVNPETKDGLPPRPGEPMYFLREKWTLKYVGKDTDTKTNRQDDVTQWGWVHTYGGKLTENIVQATARDLMAEAMLRVHNSGKYDVVLSVHDELVCEVDAWDGDQEEFDALMAETPEWAEGCPVAAEGWRGKRYRK